MIKTFADNETRKVFFSEKARRIPEDIRERARIKLLFLNVATSPEDLRNPPSNHLERLVGNRKGSLVYASIYNGVSASIGRMGIQ